MSLLNRVALVAGGSDLARTVARLFSEAGARTVTVDHEPNALGQGTEPGRDRVIRLQADLTQPAGVQHAIQETVGTLGNLDVLVTALEASSDEEFLAMEWKQWEGVVAGNLTPLFLVCQAAARHMSQRGYGRIVNIVSRDWLGCQRRANYAAAKAAAVGLTRSMALELVGRGITVNAVAAGWIDDERTRALSEDFVRSQLLTQPITRLGAPECVAQAALFLAADEASYLTGQVLYVDGGRSVLSSLTA